MSFDEEHLSEHHECQREIAALEAKLASTRLTPAEREALRGLVALWGTVHPGPVRVGGEDGVEYPWARQAPAGSTIVTGPAPPFAFGGAYAAFAERAEAELYTAARNAVAIIARLLGDTNHAD